MEELLIDTHRLFDSGFDKGNGIAVVFAGKFIVQHFQFGSNLPDCAAVRHHQIGEFLCVSDKDYRVDSVQPTGLSQLLYNLHCNLGQVLLSVSMVMSAAAS